MSIAAYPAYRSFKEIQLGVATNIPKHWGIWKISHAFKKIGSGTTPDTGRIAFYEGNIFWLQTGDLTDAFVTSTKKSISPLALREYSTLKIYPPGSLVMAMYGATIGKLGILKIEAATNQACCVFSESSIVTSAFAFYSLLVMRPHILSGAYGGGQPNISQQTIKAFRIIIPPLPEQRTIAAFLDKKCAKIDEAVQIKEQQIKLLRERRQILIQQAVTRGLNPDAPMKDSGIDWIGQIPAHWHAIKLKHATQLIQTGPFGTQLHAHDYVSSGIPLVNPKHMVQGKIEPEENCTVDEETAFRLSRYRLKSGDLIMARRGELGRCALISDQEEGWLCGTGSLMLRLKDEVFNGKYLLYLLSGKLVSETLSLESVGSTMDNLNTSLIGNLKVPFPGYKEQGAIVNYIFESTKKIDQAITIKESQITALKEYKTTLINAAVTGKIKVVPDRRDTQYADHELLVAEEVH